MERSSGRIHHPYAAIPYSAEVEVSPEARGRGLGQQAYRFGDDMLARIVDRRGKGYFLHDPLPEQSFFRGENARASGVWAEPENWGTWLCHSGGDIVLGLAAERGALSTMYSSDSARAVLCRMCQSGFRLIASSRGRVALAIGPGISPCGSEEE